MKIFALNIGDYESVQTYNLLHDDRDSEGFGKDVKESFKFVCDNYKGADYLGDREIKKLVYERLTTYYGYYDVEYEREISLDIFGIPNDDYNKDLKKMVGKKIFDKIVAHNKKVYEELNSHLFIDDERK